MNNKTTTKYSDLFLCSFPEYLGKIEKKVEDGEEIRARIMALALPLFELSSGTRAICTASLQSIGCVIKIPSILYFFFAPTDSLAFILNAKLILALPGPVDLIKSIRKAIFCFSAIFWAPFLGFAMPKSNLKLHHLAGFHQMLELTDQKKTSEKNPKTTLKGFDSIVGMREFKNQMNSIISTLQFHELAKTFNIGIPNGILFYGPPGCGKTFFAKQFAEEAEKQLKKTVSFHEISMGNVGSNIAHGVSINVKKVFDEAKMAAQANNSLAVVFIDELDTVISKPDKVNTWRDEERGTFLTMLADAGTNNILVIGATNYIDNIDPAVIRPGRFDYKIEISLPDEESRLALMNNFFDGLPKEEEINLSEWANKFEGKSIADIKAFSEVSRRIAFQKTINARMNDPKSPITTLNQEIFTSAYDSLNY